MQVSPLTQKYQSLRPTVRFGSSQNAANNLSSGSNNNNAGSKQSVKSNFLAGLLFSILDALIEAFSSLLGSIFS
jgi:hypothetical protein